MKIFLNNREEELAKEDITVKELLEIKNFTFKLLVIKINDVFVPREYYSTTKIKNGDIVSVLHLVSGG
ncbi:MAG: sulfur carrier protein ThiS [Bacteroidales bacterium]|nr:sulfur carrier protein ThiS [Bacteroidales bacterium]